MRNGGEHRRGDKAKDEKVEGGEGWLRLVVVEVQMPTTTQLQNAKVSHENICMCDTPLRDG